MKFSNVLASLTVCFWGAYSSTHAAIVDEESGRELSYDPQSIEAQKGEALGQAIVCGKNGGMLNLVSYNGNYVLIGAAHTVYKSGQLSCDEGYGSFYPDDHYYPNQTSNIVFNRPYRYAIPPLNHETVLKHFDSPLSADENSRDFAIFEILDEIVLNRQIGGLRRSMVLSDLPSDELPIFSQTTEVTAIASRNNFHARTKVSIEAGCEIYPAIGTNAVMRHTCDTGVGSSGSALTYVDDGQIIAIGFQFGHQHVRGKINSIFIRDPSNRSGDGNYFIPSEAVLRELERLFPNTPE